MLISPAVVPTATPRHVRQIAHIDRIALWPWRNRCGLYVSGHHREGQTCNRERNDWAQQRLSILFQSPSQVGSNTIRKRQIEAIGPRSYLLNGHPELVVMSAIAQSGNPELRRPCPRGSGELVWKATLGTKTEGQVNFLSVQRLPACS